MVVRLMYSWLKVASNMTDPIHVEDSVPLNAVRVLVVIVAHGWVNGVSRVARILLRKHYPVRGSLPVKVFILKVNPKNMSGG